MAVGAVRSGFTASARVVTAAAVIMFAVFAAFIPEGDTAIKPIALGLAAGIAIDAFFVRMTLVPAVMALLGEKAWWIPRWLDRVLPHFDIEGEAVERELSLADWPEPDTTAVVVAEDLDVSDDGRVLLTDVSFRAEPGDSLVVTAADPGLGDRAAPHRRRAPRADRRQAPRRRAPAARARRVGARARRRRAAARLGRTARASSSGHSADARRSS